MWDFGSWELRNLRIRVASTTGLQAVERESHEEEGGSPVGVDRATRKRSRCEAPVETGEEVRLERKLKSLLIPEEQLRIQARSQMWRSGLTDADPACSSRMRKQKHGREDGGNDPECLARINSLIVGTHIQAQRLPFYPRVQPGIPGSCVLLTGRDIKERKSETASPGSHILSSEGRTLEILTERERGSGGRGDICTASERESPDVSPQGRERETKISETCPSLRSGRNVGDQDRDG
ncbi:hypothetical protein NQZ68_017059 [Dissostichus eleginoides]|nr:hypothetical protein NQZ68_017059 [Dissostichus eleginoides]